VNRHSLVWRSLPLTDRDAGPFRWWAIAGVPGIYSTVVTLIAWDSQRSSGFPIPPFSRKAFWHLSAILIPLAQHTAIFAVVAAVIIVSLQQVFPRASIVPIWGYFIGLPTAGFLLTYRVRMAFQALRCLPLSGQQLAGLLQVFGALRGLVATFALLTIASQVFPVARCSSCVRVFARPATGMNFRRVEQTGMVSI
jgi:hypothetical protein